ncbi:LegC family aminotransferase [Bradyrhizobium yuanmingense]|uniref:LegC family aminotransferase n=1 Tax=Bradyrhizobium yuanmingense TaxID=108015 RepID=UPI000FE342BA|nr:LegC family aminotransferase [Bradyrhizobium yuanmingense]TGN75187.1 LegC family aminotransferase [Bradyrhizobium yuanmingense]
MSEARVGTTATRSDISTRTFDPKAVVDAVRRAAGTPKGILGLHEPVFAGNEVAYLEECIKSTFVSSVGPFVDRFERMLEEATGAKRAVAVVNGTAALHACFRLAGVEPGDEVISPALTFIATTNAIAYCGAVPHFVDSSFATLGMDPRALAARLERIVERTPKGAVNRETGRRIAAISPMHTFGHPVELDEIAAIARDWGIALVEDAAESLGSTYKGHAVGSQARLAALSFNGNKIVTTGGGGAILTNDEELGRRAKHLTTTAKLPHKWAFVHDEIGFNYRLPNLNAALGCAQLEQLEGFLASKRRLAAAYERVFAEVPGVCFSREPEGTTSNYWLNAILLDEAHAGRRDDLLTALNEAGFGARPAWTLMHRLPMFSDSPRGDLATAESIERRLINLPSSASIRARDE